MGPKRLLLWCALGLLGIVAMVAGAFFSPLLEVKKVEVTGVEGEAAQQVVDAMGVLDTAMLLADPAELSERASRVPWVAHAAVEKDWPNMVRIEVLPHRPTAVVSTGSASFILTTSGEHIAVGDGGPLEPFFKFLPEVTVDLGASGDTGGSDQSGSDDVDRTLMQVLRLLGTQSSEMLLSANLGEEGLELTVDGIPQTSPGEAGEEGTDNADGSAGETAAPEVQGGTAKVRFGELRNIPEKAIAMEAALGGSVLLDCLDVLDVSVPSRIVITRAPGCVMPPGPDGAAAGLTGSDGTAGGAEAPDSDGTTGDVQAPGGDGTAGDVEAPGGDGTAGDVPPTTGEDR
jgi:hypothetical protein